MDRPQPGQLAGTFSAKDSTGAESTAGRDVGEAAAESGKPEPGDRTAGEMTCDWPHLGQEIFRPAACSGALSFFWQCGHVKRIMGASSIGETNVTARAIYKDNRNLCFPTCKY